MKPFDLNQTTESPDEFVFRGRRFLEALLVALGLSVVGFACCFAALLIFSPESALERTVNHMVWVWPASMLTVFPLVLFLIERRQDRHRAVASKS